MWAQTGHRLCNLSILTCTVIDAIGLSVQCTVPEVETSKVPGVGGRKIYGPIIIPLTMQITVKDTLGTSHFTVNGVYNAVLQFTFP